MQQRTDVTSMANAEPELIDFVCEELGCVNGLLMPRRMLVVVFTLTPAEQTTLTQWMQLNLDARSLQFTTYYLIPVFST